MNGELHREDGPAIEWSDGTKVWWVNGEEMTREEYYDAGYGEQLVKACRD